MQSLQQHNHLTPYAQKTIRAVRQASSLAMLAALVMSLSGCAAIKGIFEAGVWVGIVGVIVLVALIAGGVSMFRARSR